MYMCELYMRIHEGMQQKTVNRDMDLNGAVAKGAEEVSPDLSENPNSSPGDSRERIIPGAYALLLCPSVCL
jgi:hypothetical protein